MATVLNFSSYKLTETDYSAYVWSNNNLVGYKVEWYLNETILKESILRLYFPEITNKTITDIKLSVVPNKLVLIDDNNNTLAILSVSYTPNSPQVVSLPGLVKTNLYLAKDDDEQYQVSFNDPTIKYDLKEVSIYDIYYDPNLRSFSIKSESLIPPNGGVKFIGGSAAIPNGAYYVLPKSNSNSEFTKVEYDDKAGVLIVEGYNYGYDFIYVDFKSGCPRNGRYDISLGAFSLRIPHKYCSSCNYTINVIFFNEDQFSSTKRF